MKPLSALLTLLLSTSVVTAQLEMIDLTGKIKKTYYLDDNDQLTKKAEARYIVTFTKTSDPAIIKFEKKTLAGYVRLSGSYLIDTPNLRNGEFITYYEGQKKHKCEWFKNDMLFGPAKYYAPNGKLTSEGNYIDGKKEGQWTEYMIDGSYFRGEYWHDVKEGPWKKYKNRSLLYTENYRYGKAIGQANINSSEVAIVCVEKIIGSPNSYFYGCIDMMGKEVIPLEYDFIEKVTRNKVLKVKKDGKYGILSFGGTVLIPLEYESICKFDSDSYEVTKGGKKGLVSRNNKVIIPIEYDVLGSEDWSGMIKAKKNGKWGFINRKNEVIIEFKYDWACNFGRDYAYVKVGAVWKAVDRKGKELDEKPDYNECDEDITTIMMIDDYPDNFDRKMRTEGKQPFSLKVFNGAQSKGVLDGYGNFIIPEEFKEIKWYMNGRICVQNNLGKWGFYNDLGEVEVVCKYDKVYPFGEVQE